MDAAFWHEKWQNNQINFHEGEANSLLVRHFDLLGLNQESRIFLPLCGKTRDIAWLLDKGYQVVGAELSEMAVKQLYEELGAEPRITEHGPLKCYSGPAIDIFVGDIFHLTAELLGRVDAIYDRAALVALPEDMRIKYTRHLSQITGTAPQLLITFKYDQSQMAGPPFAVPSEEVTRHYEASYKIKHLESKDVPGGLKGKCPAQENAWHLIPQE